MRSEEKIREEKEALISSVKHLKTLLDNTGLTKEQRDLYTFQMKKNIGQAALLEWVLGE